MFRNYFKTALRNIFRHKGYSVINMTGLAIGLACSLLILIYIQDELSYDAYNEKADRIYRVAGAIMFGGRDFKLATVPAPMAKTLVNDYPEVENAVRFRDAGSRVVSYGENNFKERALIFSDPEFFELFAIPLLAGDPEIALKKPYTIILSKKTAQKYFGQENPVGKVLKLDNEDDYMVTGIFDNIPHNSHFHFDLIASMASLDESRSPIWLNNNFNTYILLNKHAHPNSLEAKFPELIKKYMAPQVEQALGKSLDELVKSGSANVSFYLQPLRDIHLHSGLEGELEPNSDIKYVYIFSAIALFILILAAINFMNLSTARSAGRAKEVGIRKVMGSPRSSLIKQFLGESLLLSFISMFIAALLVILAIPYFNNLAGKVFEAADFFNGEMILLTVVITLLTGFLAGVYPAFFISAFKPINVLTGELKSGVKSGFLRRTLVVFQFAVSIILIIGTLVVMNQLHYIQNKDLGYDKEQVLILQDTHLLGSQAETFKNEMLKHPQVQYASISSFLPVPSSRSLISLFPEGKLGSKDSTSMQNWIVDYDYIKTLGMKIVKGRNFSRDFSTDTSAVIINQKAAEQFGWNEPIDKKVGKIVSDKGDVKMYTVIGVVENFHFDSLKNNIGPLAMFLGESTKMISFRINAEDIPGTIDLLRDKWKTFLPHQSFEYYFLDEKFAETYRAEQRIGKIFGTFTVLAILISSLGLFGLAAFIAEQRTKEIGIRKVLGAAVSSIIGLLSREFVILVGIANIIAWPIAYFIMNKWLQDFAYKAPLSIWLFLAAGITAVIIALLTTTFQAIKAALSDPIKSLRYE